MFKKPKLAIEDFDYVLPDAQIAYTPAPNRAESKLLVWDQTIIGESNYANIAGFLPANSTLLFNDSKVIAARILFEKNTTLNNNSPNHTANITSQQTSTINEANTIKQNTIEIFCLEPTENYTPVLLAMQATGKCEWNCLVGGAKKWKEVALHKQVIINNETVLFTAKKIKQIDGKFIIEFNWDHPLITFSEILTAIGNIPLPPYIQRKANEEDKDRYQTTYAVAEGSVAAPTAGLHFSKEVFNSLDAKNIKQKYLTLHVGAGTFMPVKAATIDEHTMHAEFVEVGKDLIEYLFEHANEMKAALTNNNNPVIAVGTTSLRTIESLYWLGVKAHRYEFVNKQVLPAHEMNLAQWEAYELNEYSLPMEDAMAALLIWLKHNQTTTLIAKTQLIVTPGYQFKICAGLITNFHQPKSTLLLIIAAITGDQWKLVYAHALKNAYRFLSYGDGSLFWIKPQAK
jgi:S-adenosylmethionine:tRNA ribosyltransferase-isomerase